MPADPLEPPLRHMNAFVPYDRRAYTHEDNLTRAFLLVLRGVPVAHAAWLDLVDQSHRERGGSGVPRLHGMAAPRFVTQTAAIPDGVRRIISLVQTDEDVFRGQDVGPSDRRQVLDGVVSYDEFALVIENKPSHRNIRPDQLRVNVPAGVEHDSKAACVAWKDIVLAWGRLLEARHLGPAETVLLGDFLDYVETYFPKLRPYSKVGLCGADLDRLERRCAELLRTLAPDDYRHHRGWGPSIRLADGQCALMIGFFPRTRDTEVDLVVEIDPADTTAQSRLMFKQVDKARLFGLGARGWSIRPNFHLAYMTQNVLYTKVTLSPEAYWDACASRKDLLRAWRREEFGVLFDTLVKARLAAPSDRAAFDEKLTATRRDKINVCTGLELRWRIPVEDAAVLDARGQLEDRVRAAIVEGAEALGLRVPAFATRP